jgi:hypothetical protein
MVIVRAHFPRFIKTIPERHRRLTLVTCLFSLATLLSYLCALVESSDLLGCFLSGQSPLSSRLSWTETPVCFIFNNCFVIIFIVLALIVRLGLFFGARRQRFVSMSEQTTNSVADQIVFCSHHRVWFSRHL